LEQNILKQYVILVPACTGINSGGKPAFFINVHKIFNWSFGDDQIYLKHNHLILPAIIEQNTKKPTQPLGKWGQGGC
jgi:hypothetical protein